MCLKYLWKKAFFSSVILCSSLLAMCGLTQFPDERCVIGKEKQSLPNFKEIGWAVGLGAICLNYLQFNIKTNLAGCDSFRFIKRLSSFAARKCKRVRLAVSWFKCVCIAHCTHHNYIMKSRDTRSERRSGPSHDVFQTSCSQRRHANDITYSGQLVDVDLFPQLKIFSTIFQ